MTTKYPIYRQSLTFARVVEVVQDAHEKWKSTPGPETRVLVYMHSLIPLLPTDARDLGEAWSPSDTSCVSDWARCGAYLGAIDGYHGTMWLRNRPNATQAFLSAYALAYWTARPLFEANQT